MIKHGVIVIRFRMCQNVCNAFKKACPCQLLCTDKMSFTSKQTCLTTKLLSEGDEDVVEE